MGVIMANAHPAVQVAYERPAPANVNKRHKANMSLLDRAGFGITRAVGTMVCAVVFFGLSLVSLPAAIKSHDLIIIVGWIAQTFLQLVLLPIIMVGQNIQSKHSEVMADEEFKTTQTTYKDLEHLIALNQQQLELLAKLDRQH